MVNILKYFITVDFKIKGETLKKQEATRRFRRSSDGDSCALSLPFWLKLKTTVQTRKNCVRYSLLCQTNTSLIKTELNLVCFQSVILSYKKMEVEDLSCHWKKAMAKIIFQEMELR
ncbi:hypothetical protein YC2023_047155 [Brassica napus]